MWRAVVAVTAPDADGAHYTSFAGFAHLGAGLACGLSSLAAGLAIGVVGDAGVRAVGQNEKLFVGMILVRVRCLASCHTGVACV